MKVVKCINGHWFDLDSYDFCPHCGAKVQGEEKADKDTVKPATSFESKDSEVTETTEPYSDDKWTIFGDEEQQNENDFFEELFMEDNHKSEEDRHISDMINNSILPNIEDMETGSRNIFPKSKTAPEINDSLEAGAEMDSDDDMTRVFFDNSCNNTEKLSNSHSDYLEPVVGWLVCIQGIHKGRSFEIVSGKNSIGRHMNNRIILDKDNSVSRQKHAIITYEPKKRNFYIQPGDERGLTYLNDEYVTQSTLMKKNDIIEIGQSKLMLIPLCGDEFNWESREETEE